MELIGLKIFRLSGPTMTAPPTTPKNSVAMFIGASRHSERVIVPINDSALVPESVLPTFYCVHSISGMVRTDFGELAQRLEPVRFYGIQAPTKRIKDPDFGASIQSLAEHYVRGLIEFQPRGPLMLGGYCAGAVVALEMAQKLRALGREVGPLIVIDGAPENIGAALKVWQPGYWVGVARNLPGWLAHADLMRNSSPRSWLRSAVKKISAVIRSAMGLKLGEKWGGGYTVEGLMDLSPYSPPHRLFINRLFGSLFTYLPNAFPSEVIVYEARVTPLLYVPQIGAAWQRFAPNTEIVGILATHIAMMHAPYVDGLAKHLKAQVEGFFSRDPPLTSQFQPDGFLGR